jgi:hypothetical protein
MVAAADSGSAFEFGACACPGTIDESRNTAAQNSDLGSRPAPLQAQTCGAILSPRIGLLFVTISHLDLQLCIQLSGAGDPSDHVPVSIMNVLIGSGSPFARGSITMGDLSMFAPHSAGLIFGV